MKYQQACSTCGKFRTFANKGSMKRAIENKAICKACARLLLGGKPMKYSKPIKQYDYDRIKQALVFDKYIEYINTGEFTFRVDKEQKLLIIEKEEVDQIYLTSSQFETDIKSLYEKTNYKIVVRNRL